MNFRWVGPVALLAALVIGDQIRINRPGHKYRLSVEIDTPGGVKSGSGVMAVQPDRGYSRGGATRTKGDAIFVDLGGGKNLIALLAHLDRGVELDGMNYLALRAYNAAGPKTSFSTMSQKTGVVPVTGDLVPVLATCTDVSDPATMRALKSDNLAATLGTGFGLRVISVEVVPNGLWPLDFGGFLGEPLTRGIEAELPWLGGGSDSAAIALRAAALPLPAGINAREVFTRK